MRQPSLPSLPSRSVAHSATPTMPSQIKVKMSSPTKAPTRDFAGSSRMGPDGTAAAAFPIALAPARTGRGAALAAPDSPAEAVASPPSPALGNHSGPRRRRTAERIVITMPPTPTATNTSGSSANHMRPPRARSSTAAEGSSGSTHASTRAPAGRRPTTSCLPSWPLLLPLMKR